MQELLSIFKALSDETRIRIIRLLQQGELCVCDITAALDMVQPKVSFHLRALKEAGLVIDRKEGKWMHYRIDEGEMFKRFLLLSVMEKVPGGEFGEDDRRLGEFLKSKAKSQQPVTCCGAP